MRDRLLLRRSTRERQSASMVTYSTKRTLESEVTVTGVVSPAKEIERGIVLPGARSYQKSRVGSGKVDVLDFLGALGVKIEYNSAGNVGFCCPFHSDSKPSARMSVESSAWLCLGCGVKGHDAVSFLARMRNIPMEEAQKLVEERYGSEDSIPIGGLQVEVERNLAGTKIELREFSPPSDLWIRKTLVSWNHVGDWEPGRYMLDRGFLPGFLDWWMIGYDQISDRITIPVRDENGKIVGVKGRSWNGREPKYLILGDTPQRTPRYGFDTYRKSEYVYGLHLVHPTQVPVIIVEGELNVIAMHQHGYVNVVAVAGSDFSQTQAEKIISRASSVIAFFDSDSAGQRGTPKIIEALAERIPVRVVRGATGDAAELSKPEVDALIANAESSLELRVRGEL